MEGEHPAKHHNDSEPGLGGDSSSALKDISDHVNELESVLESLNKSCPSPLPPAKSVIRPLSSRTFLESLKPSTKLAPESSSAFTSTVQDPTPMSYPKPSVTEVSFSKPSDNNFNKFKSPLLKNRLNNNLRTNVSVRSSPNVTISAESLLNLAQHKDALKQPTVIKPIPLIMKAPEGRERTPSPCTTEHETQIDVVNPDTEDMMEVSEQGQHLVAGGGVRGNEMGVRGSEMGVRGNELGVRVSEAGVSGSEMGVRGSEMGMRGGEAGVRGSESEPQKSDNITTTTTTSSSPSSSSSLVGEGNQRYGTEPAAADSVEPSHTQQQHRAAAEKEPDSEDPPPPQNLMFSAHLELLHHRFESHTTEDTNEITIGLKRKVECLESEMNEEERSSPREDMMTQEPSQKDRHRSCSPDETFNGSGEQPLKCETTGDHGDQAGDLTVIPTDSELTQQLMSVIQSTIAQTTNTITCHECGLLFANEVNLHRHMLVHLESNADPTTTSSSIKEQFNCPTCAFKTPRRQTLAKHITTVHSRDRSSGILYCDQCEYKTPTKSHLRNHMLAHSGNRQYQCPHCTYNSNFSNALTRHMTMHSREMFESKINSAKSS